MTRGRTVAASLGAVATVGVAALAWGVAIERNRFTVRTETLPVLDPGGRALTILHLSDIHLAPWQARKRDWLESLTALEPDLIVNTGDNLGHVDALDALEQTLSVFRGIPGVYVNGSNDYFGPVLKNPFGYFRSPTRSSASAPRLDTARMEAFFADELGWLDLNNRVHALELKGSRLELFGVNDAHRGWDRLDRLPAQLEQLRESHGWQSERTGVEAVAIGVTHAPYRRVLDAFVTNGADVIFAGHTHGGQVRVPGLPALVTNSDIPREQAQGVSIWQHARRAAFLNVSAGIGTSIYAPVRFACPPEAVVVTLNPTDFSYS